MGSNKNYVREGLKRAVAALNEAEAANVPPAAKHLLAFLGPVKAFHVCQTNTDVYVDRYIGVPDLRFPEAHTLFDPDTGHYLYYCSMQEAILRETQGLFEVPSRTEVHFQLTEQDTHMLAPIRIQHRLAYEANSRDVENRCDGWFKAVVALILSLALFLPATGCGGASNANLEANRINCAGDRLPPTPDTFP